MTNQAAPLFEELWDYGQPEETEKQFRELLPEMESAGNPSALVQLWTQIGRTYSLRYLIDAAHEILDKAEGMLTPELTTAHIRCLLERGRTFNVSNRKEEACQLFTNAYELALDAEESYYAADAAHMLGIAAATVEKQLEWNLIAMMIAERATDKPTRQWLGPLYNNIGWTYHDMGNYEKALALFEKSLKWRQEEAEPQRPVPIRIAKWCIGRTFRSLNRLPEALAIQQALMAEWATAGGEDGYVIEEMAECLLALDRQEEARPFFEKAYANLSQDTWLAEHEQDRLNRLKALAQQS